MYYWLLADGGLLLLFAFVWIGVGQDPRLELLHHDVEVAFEGLGFEVEGRPFRPHLTFQ